MDINNLAERGVMPMKYDELIHFVEDVLNEGNKLANAVCYDEGFFGPFAHVRISFKRNHRELYGKLLVFCAERGGTIFSTTPSTLETVVRVDIDAPKRRCLKDIRKEARLSVQELAEQTGVNEQMIHKYENGSKDINKAAASTLKLLAVALNCSIEDLID